MRIRRSLSRRGFLRGAAIGAAAVAVNPILSLRRIAGANEGLPGRFLVVINMLGGSDGLNVVVPAHLQPYVDRRPNINLVDNAPSGTALLDLVGSQFKLHYELDNIQQLWNDNDLHIVNKVSYPNPNQSHFTSMDIMGAGIRDYEGDGDGRGWLGRFADLYCADPIEPLGVISVGLGKRLDFESDVTAPLIIGSVESFVVDSSEDLNNRDHALREAVVRNTLATDPVPQADPGFTIFNTNRLAYDLVDRVQTETANWTDPGTYPNTALGRYLRTISQLLEGRTAFGSKVFYTGFGGHDTHSTQIGRQASLMQQLDDAVGAFTADLKARFLWNDCVIVVISEFGRRVFENGSQGTDHGHGNCFLVMGGRVKGRNDVGSGMTSEIVEADIATTNTLPFAVDFRNIYGSIIEKHIGVQGEPLFPDPDFTADFQGLDLVS